MIYIYIYRTKRGDGTGWDEVFTFDITPSLTNLLGGRWDKEFSIFLGFVVNVKGGVPKVGSPTRFYPIRRIRCVGS